MSAASPCIPPCLGAVEGPAPPCLQHLQRRLERARRNRRRLGQHLGPMLQQQLLLLRSAVLLRRRQHEGDLQGAMDDVALPRGVDCLPAHRHGPRRQQRATAAVMLRAELH